MQNLDIPIFKKTYDLYKIFHGCHPSIPKQDRYTVWQKCEESLLAVLEGILLASQISKTEKIPVLEKTSLKLNLLRVFIRLAKDIRAIDGQRYISIEAALDEIGRMLGGWIRSTKER